MAKHLHKTLMITLIAVGGLVGLVLLAVGVIYSWPLKDWQLQRATAVGYSHSDAVEYVRELNNVEGLSNVDSACTSRILTHGQRTAKAVLMLHGYTACPSQFADLAQYFFERGYNVYVPLAPDHGRRDQVQETYTSVGLVNFASKSMDIAAALGDEVGVVGLSAGGVMGTWLAEYRTDVVSRLLVLSPFYETSAERLPKWQVKPFLVLYGNNILPDARAATNPNLSYRSLAQYLRITSNLREKPQNERLRSVGSVVSYTDHEIDHQLAREIPEKLANTNSVRFEFYQPPIDWNLGHDIVKATDNPDIQDRAPELFPKYFSMYEGTIE